MVATIALIGFGEAGQAFAPAGAAVFDRKTLDPATRPAKLDDYRACAVRGCDNAAAALAEAEAVLCLVTADQALAAARDDAALLRPGALWIDMNSVAPATKQAAAAAIGAAGGRYVDVAIMSPVLPARHKAPLLVAGEAAEEAADLLRTIGFTDVSVAGTHIGDASAIKMIRSVMVKGLEALSAECALAAHRAGVSEAVFASLDRSPPPRSWTERIDYNLDRMLVHGERRAAEMEQVASTLEALGVEPLMTRGTIQRQRAVGAHGPSSPLGLAAKLAALETLA